MPRASPFQGNFSSGEFSPLLFGRTDSDRYKSGLERCFNQIPTLQGGATRRAGTKYVNNAKSNAYTRMIPFRFSSSQNFMLEFGDLYVRFYTNRGRLETSPGVPYEIVSPFSQTVLQRLKYAQSLDVIYITDKDVGTYTLSRFSNFIWAFQAFAFSDGPYMNINTDPRLGLTPGAATGLTTLTVTASDLTFSDIANNGSGLMRLTVSSTATLLNNDFMGFTGGIGGGIPTGTCYNITIVDATHIDLQRSTYTATASGLTGTFNFAVFARAIPGQWIRLLQGSIWGIGQVVTPTVGSPTYKSIAFNVINTLTNTTSKAVWRMGAYTDASITGPGIDPTTTFRYQGSGFPSCLVFHEDRLYFGGAGGALSRIDGSNVGNYLDFSPSKFANGSTTDNTTIVDSGAVSFTILSGQSNQIQWMTSDEKGMPIGTTGGPYIMRASTLGVAITPTNISIKPITTYPSSNFAPAVAGKSSIYIEQNLRRVRELGYFYDVDGFRAVDLSELAEHLPAPGIATELAFQNSPQNILWCARADGALLGITYDRTVDTLRTGWHQHQLGGVSDAAGTPPVVESLAVIPSVDGKSDDVWMSVKRYINGTTIRTIEYMTKIFESFNLQQDAYFLDCGISFDNSKTIDTITSGTTTNIHSVAHGLSTGDKVRLQNIVGLNAVNNVQYVITVVDANNFTIPFNSTGMTYIFTSSAVYRKQVKTLSGLTWLEGQTVSVLGDGAVLSDAVVTSGAITLSAQSGVVQIGLKYSSEIKQLRLEAGSADGTSIGKVRRMNEVAFLIERTAAFEYGVNFTDMDLISMRQPSDAMDFGAPLFSGIKDGNSVRSDYDTENQICLRQTDPLPMTILAIMPQIVTQDKA